MECIKEEVNLRISEGIPAVLAGVPRRWGSAYSGRWKCPAEAVAMPVQVRSTLPGAQEGSKGRREGNRVETTTMDSLGR